MFIPIYLLRYPSIVFSGLLVGSVLSWYNVFLGTMTSVFGGAPYHFSANMIGLTYLACVIGTSLGVSLLDGQMTASPLGQREETMMSRSPRLVSVLPLFL